MDITSQKRNTQTLTNSFENIIISSERQSNLIETDGGSEFANKTFPNLLNTKDIRRYSTNTSLGAVFSKRFDRTFRDLLKRPVFGKSDGNWVDVLPTITKHYNNRAHTATKLTPIQASLKKNEGFVYNNLLNKRKKINPKFQVNNLVRIADLKKTFPKLDTTN